MSFKNIGEGTEIVDVPCVVSKRRKHRGEFLYSITDGEGELELESRSFFSVGQELRASGKVVNDRGFMKLHASNVEKTEGDYSSILEKADSP